MVNQPHIQGSLRRLLPVLIFLIGWLPSWGQTPEALLRKAGTFYERDQLDSATAYYQQLYRLDGPEDRLNALGGFVKVAIRRTEMDRADSLLREGTRLLETGQVGMEAECAFLTIKGEFLGKNSEFERALQVHLEVVRRSAEVEDRRIYANALFYTGLTYERMTFYDSSVYYVE